MMASLDPRCREWLGGRFAVAGVMLAATVALGCQAAPPTDAAAREATLVAEFPGRAATPAIDHRGLLHVAYVLPQAGGERVALRSIGSSVGGAVAASPAGEVVDLPGEDRPELVTLSDGSLLLAYSVTRPGGTHHPASELRTQRSSDGGKTWQPPRPVPDTAPRSHAFTDLVATRDGGAVLSWLDSRSGKQGVQALRIADDGPPTVTTVDPMTCQCCRTALHATARGDVWLAYRDVTAEKVRNMAFAVSADGGRTFVARGDVFDDHWVVDGCPESGPRFAETADGAVWLAWFDGADGAIEVARTRGGGFEPPRIVARTDADTTLVNHPEIGILADGRPVVFYEAFRRGERLVEARVAQLEAGTWSAPRLIARGASAPVYAHRGDLARLAYTSWEADEPRVRVVDPSPAFGGR
jgi:hypothetical protein